MNLKSKGIIQFEAQREKLVDAKSHDDLWEVQAVNTHIPRVLEIEETTAEKHR